MCIRDRISDDIAEKMKRSGCMGVMMGIESASPEMLKNMNKHINLNTAKQVFKILKKADIITYAMFIVGFPGETEATINQTIDFINEAKPDFYALSPWNYNTEAPIYNQREKYGLFGQGNNWHHNTMHLSLIHLWINMSIIII